MTLASIAGFGMRAYNTNLGRYVYWQSDYSPDFTGVSSIYNPVDLTDIILIGPPEVDGYFSLGGSALLNVGTTAGTVAGGDLPQLRLGKLVLGSDTFTVDFSLARLQTRSAVGAVTITLSNLAVDAGVSVHVLNTTGAPIAVTVTPTVRWFTAAPLTLAAGKLGILSMISDGTTEAEVVATWAAEI
jgi:hypothetical protein